MAEYTLHQLTADSYGGQGGAWVRVTQFSNICLYVRFSLVIYKGDASKLEAFAC